MRSLCSWCNCCACYCHPGKHPPLLQLARWQACVIPWLPKLSPALPPLLLHPSPCATTSHKRHKKIQEYSKCKNAQKGLVNSSQESQWRQNGRSKNYAVAAVSTYAGQRSTSCFLLIPCSPFYTLSAAAAMDWARGGDSRNQGRFAAIWLLTEISCASPLLSLSEVWILSPCQAIFLCLRKQPEMIYFHLMHLYLLR